MFAALKNFFGNLFGKKSKWDTADYGNKPSNAGDDFRERNNV